MADMTFTLTDEQRALKAAVYELCKQYPAEYWRELDAKREYPEAFVSELTKAGYLAVLIPEEYGGGGLGIMEAALILEEIKRAGGNPAACHAQMYIMGTVLRHGTEAQKREYLPKIATGELRLQAFGVTEPNAGSDTTKLQTTAVRKGDRYVVNGQKMFISRVLQSDLMLLLARTTPVDQVKKKTDGLSVFLIDIRELKGKGLDVRPLRMMMNHSTNALFFDNMEIPATSLIGQEGKGFSYILDGMNAERILVASDSLGDARWFTEKAVAYAGQRVIFGRPIGANQGVQFPIAKAHMDIEAADLMRTKAARCSTRASLRPRGQHGQVPGRGGGHGGGQRLHRLPRRLRLRRGVRHRAQVPRVAPLPGRADQQQPGHGLRRRARPRHAPVVLRVVPTSSPLPSGERAG